MGELSTPKEFKNLYIDGLAYIDGFGEDTDMGDYDIHSMDGLYGFDDNVYIDMGVDGTLTLAADTTIPINGAVDLTNTLTDDALKIIQSGNLATGKGVLYIDNNGTPVDGAGKAIRFDGCTATGTADPRVDPPNKLIWVNLDGTWLVIPAYTQNYPSSSPSTSPSASPSSSPSASPSGSPSNSPSSSPSASA